MLEQQQCRESEPIGREVLPTGGPLRSLTGKSVCVYDISHKGLGGAIPTQSHSRPILRLPKGELKRTIKTSQRGCRQKLAKDLNSNPWRLEYKIVTHKLGAFAQGSPRDAQTITTIVDTLFPTNTKRPW